MSRPTDLVQGTVDLLILKVVALEPIHGLESVARFVFGRARSFASPERTMRPGQINGQPGFIVYVSGRPLAAMILHIRDGRIRTIYAVGNPDKLHGLVEAEQDA